MAYHRVLFLGETFVERDALRFTLPSREFLAASLKAGRLPEWFDGVNFGTPFAANPAHEALAPLGWTFAFLPMPIGSDLYSILLVLIGGLGAAALARRFGATPAGCVLAGAAVSLGGYVTSMVPNGLVPCPPWTPWVAWAADRLAAAVSAEGQTRRPKVAAVAVLAATLALQLHAGEPASVLMAGALAWAVVLARSSRPWVSSALVGVSALGAALLAASATWTGVLLFSQSARAAGLDQGGLEMSLHPARLLETVWPTVFGSQRADGWLGGVFLLDRPGGPFWSYSLFLGLPVLVCAAAAAFEKSVRRLLVASAVFLLLAAGRYTPVFALLQVLFPPLRFVNFPEKFVYGALLIWAVAAGVGLSRLSGTAPVPALREVTLGGTAVLGIGLALTIAGRDALVSTAARKAADGGVLVNVEAGVAAVIEGGVVATVGAGLFVVALALRPRMPKAFMVLALAASFGPLVWSSASSSPLAPRSLVSEPPAVLREVTPPAHRREELPRPRLFRLDPIRPSGPFRDGAGIARDYHESIDTNIASRFGLAVVGGFEPAESARSREFGRRVFPRLDLRDFATLTGVSWLAARDPESLGLPLPVVSRGEEGWALLGTGAIRPRAFVAPRWRVAFNADEALEDLAAPGRGGDPGAVTLIGVAPASGDSAARVVPCGIRVLRPEEVTLDCASPEGGFAVLLDEWAPGWSASVDGRPETIRLADGLFRAVRVDRGRHRIVFRYRTPGLRAGAVVSLVSWLAFLGLLIWCRSGTPRQTASLDRQKERDASGVVP